MDFDERNTINNDENIHLISAYDFNQEQIIKLLPKLKDKVYITIDVDVFDPSIIRNTGTPEPGGLTWNNIINSLKIIFKNKQVIGADIVEFAPNNNADSEAYTLAKLAYKIMALKYNQQQ
jgi:agmatinase